MRKRIYTPAAIRWEANPFHELCKLRAKELGITVKDAAQLINLEQEMAKIPAN